MKRVPFGEEKRIKLPGVVKRKYLDGETINVRIINLDLGMLEDITEFQRSRDIFTRAGVFIIKNNGEVEASEDPYFIFFDLIDDDGMDNQFELPILLLPRSEEDEEQPRDEDAPKKNDEERPSETEEKGPQTNEESKRGKSEESPSLEEEDFKDLEKPLDLDEEEFFEEVRARDVEFDKQELIEEMMALDEDLDSEKVA